MIMKMMTLITTAKTMMTVMKPDDKDNDNGPDTDVSVPGTAVIIATNTQPVLVRDLLLTKAMAVI